MSHTPTLDERLAYLEEVLDENLEANAHCDGYGCKHEVEASECVSYSEADFSHEQAVADDIRNVVHEGIVQAIESLTEITKNSKRTAETRNLAAQALLRFYLDLIDRRSY